jgi:uncharacterized protein
MNQQLELTAEFLSDLKVNEVDLMRQIAAAIKIGMNQVSTVIGLLADGSTVPFIARYRKEMTGSLDEVQIRDISHQFNSGKNLETRRLEIIRLIFEQGKLNSGLYEAITKADTLAALEDIYAPYKRKKKTRGMIATEKGLLPLADAMKELNDISIREKAKEFIIHNEEATELSVATIDDALQGAMDIIAEQTSQENENQIGRAHV